MEYYQAIKMNWWYKQEYRYISKNMLSKSSQRQKGMYCMSDSILKFNSRQHKSMETEIRSAVAWWGVCNHLEGAKKSEIFYILIDEVT